MDYKYYKELIKLAKKAQRKKDVPVGAIIVSNNKIIARAYNKRNLKNNSLYHAEILAINKCCNKLKRWILDDCELYVLLKPCSMCEGAIRQARIKKVYYILDKDISKKEYYKTNIEHLANAVQISEYKDILREFFQKKRDKK